MVPSSATPVSQATLNARTGLYAATWLFALLTMALSAASLNATLNSFYGFGLEATCELIAAGSIAMLVIPPFHFYLHRRPSDHPLASVNAEIIVLIVLFALFLGGAAATARNIRALEYWFGSYEDIYPLTAAAMAMAWITWFLTWALLTLVLVAASGAQKTQGSGVWGRQLGSGAVDGAVAAREAKQEMAGAPAGAPVAAAPAPAQVA